MRLITRVLCLLVVSAAGAQAQGSDSTMARNVDAPAPVTLQDFTATLGVAAPSGQLVRSRALSPGMKRLYAAMESMREGQLRSVVAAPPTGDTSIVCPMPVARVDSATLSPMPVVTPTAELPIAGRLKGCENPLGPR